MFDSLNRHLRVLGLFVRNAAAREWSFRSNILLTFFSRGFWFGVQVFLFDLIYKQVPTIQDWNREEYFVFMATGMLINGLVEAFFMPNCANFSELIRTGNLDFALLKPVDTQFLVSLEKIDLAMGTQLILVGLLLSYALVRLPVFPDATAMVCWAILVVAAVVFFYSLMISLACTSIAFGRNQSLLDFWFYITIFSRYPGGIYSGTPSGEIVRFLFSYVIPILLVVTVPARVLAGMTLSPSWILLFTVTISAASLLLSRAVFRYSLRFYRSASS